MSGSVPWDAGKNPPDDQHAHQCRHCRTRWAHPDTAANDEAAHRCPGCGQIEWVPEHYRVAAWRTIGTVTGGT